MRHFNSHSARQPWADRDAIRAEVERDVLRSIGGHLRNGYSRHLGGPWYVARSPDSGRLSFTKDHGTGTHPVPMREVPTSVIERALGR